MATLKTLQIGHEFVLEVALNGTGFKRAGSDELRCDRGSRN
jgi:hypothetical protein